MRYWVKFEKNGWIDLASGEMSWGGCPDPFSRVARPALKPGWSRDLGLTEEERRRVLRSEVAYTRLFAEDLIEL